MRLRKEYLYRKSLEGKEKEAFERKKRIKDAMAGMFGLFPSSLVLRLTSIEPQPAKRFPLRPEKKQRL